MFVLVDVIPPTARRWVYAILGAVNAVEGALDAFGLGLLSQRQFGVLLAVSSALGFTMASANVSKPDDLPKP